MQFRLGAGALPRYDGFSAYALSKASRNAGCTGGSRVTTARAQSKYSWDRDKDQPTGGLFAMSRRLQILSAIFTNAPPGDFSCACDIWSSFLRALGRSLSSVISNT